MDDRVKYLLLLILENNGNIEQLVELGYSYTQVSELIKEEISLGNAIFSENKIVITDKGVVLKDELSKRLEYSKLENLISPLLSAFIKDNKDESFFIPSLDELPD